MAKKAIKEETLPVAEPIVVETTPVVETEEAVEVGETIVEELPVPEVEEVVEEVVETKPAPAAPRAGNEVGVVRIVQKTPSGYRLLLETGEVVKVPKTQYTKGQTTIIL